MSEKNEKEKAIWNIFWERYKKMYPGASLLRDLFNKELVEAWKAVSTKVGKEEEAFMRVTEEGRIRATQLEWLKMGIFCEFIIRRIPEIYGKELKVVDEIEKLLPKLKEMVKEREGLLKFQEKGR